MEKNKYVEAFIQTITNSVHTSMAGATRKLSRGEEGVLRNLYITDIPLTPGQLQKRLCVGSGRIGNILKSLEDKNMIVRMADKKDSRRTLVSLTDHGLRHVEEDYQQFAKTLERFVNEYGEEEYYHFLEEVTRFSKAFSKANKKEES